MKKFFKTHAKLCIAVLALALVTVGGTLALMAVSSNSVINIFTAAGIDTEINEVVGEGTKQVSITNKGPSDAYVRARIMVSGVEKDQVKIVSVEPENVEPDKVYLVMPNSATWQQAEDKKEKDDFYYYLGVVKAKGSTNNLLEEVVFGKNLQNDEFLAGFNITVYHESVLAIEQPEEGVKPDLAMVKRAFTNAVPTATPGT
ncbi:hypothetical protein [Allofournierella massiliensis]|uniref:Ribosomally synthesized peptide with SipW-like signal peptide n=1 Tax=Allofournierella massiliensis TaxID=1650663 RepID=A0ABT7UU46_9FIRM|nr:hypothetical protein [Fournierella massiliensis]MDM8201770.1 hypothetical protein [Fournierella massiliensis]